MKLSEAYNIHPGMWVRVLGKDFSVTGRLGYVEVDLHEAYVETTALCEAEPTRHPVSREPTVRMTVGRWESPEFRLYSDDETIEIEVIE